MASPSKPAAGRLGRVLVNHLGFPCSAKKEVVVRGEHDGGFVVQDMGIITTAVIGEHEDFKPVMAGALRRVESPFGVFSVGDFSSLTAPGIYRVVLAGTLEHSYQFAVTDGAFSWLPAMFLGFMHNWRSGRYENAWRGPSHLDDARRTDNGLEVDVVGGWYDAGDLRKWMVHSNLPALAMMEAHERLPWHYAEWERVEEGWSPWLLEARWGLDFMLKMQDPSTGMFYEDVAGGGSARFRPGMTWWCENHAGCYADNTENHFTDNVPGSGAVRPVRVQYNPVGQFTSAAILARAAAAYAALDPGRARRCGEAAERGWRVGLAPEALNLASTGDDFAMWTCVRAWRTLAALALHRCGRLPWADVAASARGLLENFDPRLGFWMNRTGGVEPYRGILHSAQPLIALAEISLAAEDQALREEIAAILRRCVEAYVLPLSGLSPFGIIPFGLYREPASKGDQYRPWGDGLLLRFFMPVHHSQRINHGLGGHWSSWAHALALAGRVLGDQRLDELAWRQLHWLLGCNTHNSCLVSGAGYNNPMPHSRFLGTYPGGFCNGFNGSAEDQPLLDLEGNAQWNSVEYWVTPLSNTLMALGLLNPPPADASRKLGWKTGATNG